MGRAAGHQVAPPVRRSSQPKRKHHLKVTRFTSSKEKPLFVGSGGCNGIPWTVETHQLLPGDQVWVVSRRLDKPVLL